MKPHCLAVQVVLRLFFPSRFIRHVVDDLW